jgi:hypothetical protein
MRNNVSLLTLRTGAEMFRRKTLYEELGWRRDNAEAMTLQQGVRHDESEQVGIIDYSDEQIRQAIVHTREDVVLLVYWLTESARAARANQRRLSAILFFLAVATGTLVWGQFPDKPPNMWWRTYDRLASEWAQIERRRMATFLPILDRLHRQVPGERLPFRGV